VKTSLGIAIMLVGIWGVGLHGGIVPAENTAQTVGSNTSSPVSSILQKSLVTREAYIWYLLHCGYAIKTPTKLLIFDYVRSTRDFPDTISIQSLATGRINPRELNGLDIYVFVTHDHEDHFDPVILDWGDQIENLTYIFGWRATDDSSHYNLIDPRASLHFDEMDILTINCQSGVPEVAYLVKTDGLTIFFQGDYKSDSPADIDYLLDQCDTVDMAFLGATPQRWAEASARIVDMMKRLDPQVVFPMHYGGKEKTYQLFADECAERGLPYVIKCPKKPGDRFYYRRVSAL
jgi:L-ascorbate metabolism protein UlaG (beta-lactamase superfamily)